MVAKAPKPSEAPPVASAFKGSTEALAAVTKARINCLMTATSAAVKMVMTRTWVTERRWW